MCAVNEGTHMNANSMPNRDPMAFGVVNLSGMLRRVCPRYPIVTGVSVEILMTPELICGKASVRKFVYRLDSLHDKHDIV